jgi:small subunit ribosomal protein S18
LNSKTFSRKGPRKKGRINKKRSVKYILPKDAKLEYKNISLIQKYLTDRGKILSRRITGITGKEQREIMIAIKRARYLGLLSVGSSKKR